MPDKFMWEPDDIVFTKIGKTKDPEKNEGGPGSGRYPAGSGEHPDGELKSWKPLMSDDEADTWCGNSFVKDELYRGTATKEFQNKERTDGCHIALAGHAAFGDGVYLTNSKEETKVYGQFRNDCRINIKNPLDMGEDWGAANVSGMSEIGKDIFKFSGLGKDEEWKFMGDMGKYVTKYCKEKGYDAVILDVIKEKGIKYFIVFDPKNVVVVDHTA